MDGTGAFTVHRPDHWIFEGTGSETRRRLRRQGHRSSATSATAARSNGATGSPSPPTATAPRRTSRSSPPPPPAGIPTTAEWYEQWEKGREGNAVLGIYTRGGTVVTAGTTDWAHGLRGGDPVVERITNNILDNLSKPK